MRDLRLNTRESENQDSVFTLRPLIDLVARIGWGQQRARERTKDASCDGHLVRPVDPAAVGKVVADLGSPWKATPEMPTIWIS